MPLDLPKVRREIFVLREQSPHGVDLELLQDLRACLFVTDDGHFSNVIKYSVPQESRLQLELSLRSGDITLSSLETLGDSSHGRKQIVAYLAEKGYKLTVK